MPANFIESPGRGREGKLAGEHDWHQPWVEMHQSSKHDKVYLNGIITLATDFLWYPTLGISVFVRLLAQWVCLDRIAVFLFTIHSVCSFFSCATFFTPVSYKVSHKFVFQTIVASRHASFSLKSEQTHRGVWRGISAHIYCFLVQPGLSVLQMMINIHVCFGVGLP